MIFRLTPALWEISLLRTVLLCPRSSTLLPSFSAGSVLPTHTLSSKTLSCAFSLTSKHSDPNVRITLRVTTLRALASFACIGWSSEFGLVPM